MRTIFQILSLPASCNLASCSDASPTTLSSSNRSARSVTPGNNIAKSSIIDERRMPAGAQARNPEISQKLDN